MAGTIHSVRYSRSSEYVGYTEKIAREYLERALEEPGVVYAYLEDDVDHLRNEWMGWRLVKIRMGAKPPPPVKKATKKAVRSRVPQENRVPKVRRRVPQEELNRARRDLSGTDGAFNYDLVDPRTCKICGRIHTYIHD